MQQRRYSRAVDTWGVAAVLLDVLLHGKLKEICQPPEPANLPAGWLGAIDVEKLAVFVTGGVGVGLYGRLTWHPSGSSSVRDFIGACCGLGKHNQSWTAEELLQHPWLKV